MKRRKTALLFCLMMTGSAALYAQLPPAVQEMVAAERAFALLSKTTNTRNAFLSYLTDSTILFQKGKPVKGMKSWKERPADTTLLFWEPVFVGIDANGTMGFSTGPWQWSENRNATPSAFGFFASVWTKRSGNWKLAADIGISFPETYESRQLNHLTAPAGNASPKRTIAEADSIYSYAIATDKTKQRSLLSANALILRDGVPPFNRDKIKILKHQEGTRLKSRQSGCEISEGNDFGFCYGSIELSGIANSTTNENRSYLRVFNLNKEGEWEVVMDVESR